MNEWVWNIVSMLLAGETELLGEKSVLVPLCPPQIPHGLSLVLNLELHGLREVTNRQSCDSHMSCWDVNRLPLVWRLTLPPCLEDENCILWCDSVLSSARYNIPEDLNRYQQGGEKPINMCLSSRSGVTGRLCLSVLLSVRLSPSYAADKLLVFL
jgi:hypothetical protein